LSRRAENAHHQRIDILTFLALLNYACPLDEAVLLVGYGPSCQLIAPAVLRSRLIPDPTWLQQRLA